MITFALRERGFSIKLAKSKLKEINKNAVLAVGNYWHDHFRPKHFTPAGAREYGYQPRNVRYMIQKAKKWGHRNPLEWSGESKSLSRIKDLRATATSSRARVRIVMHMPKLNFIPRGGTINMNDEMTRVSQAEIAKLGEIAADSIDAQMSALSDNSTRRIA